MKMFISSFQVLNKINLKYIYKATYTVSDVLFHK